VRIKEVPREGSKEKTLSEGEEKATNEDAEEAARVRRR